MEAKRAIFQSVYPNIEKNTSGFVLSENDSFRKLFFPIVITNSDGSKTVDGSIVVQRKGLNDSWENQNSLSLGSLKKGEWAKIDFRHDEVERFVSSIRAVADHSIQLHSVVMTSFDGFLSDDEIEKFEDVLNRDPSLICTIADSADKNVDLSSALAAINANFTKTMEVLDGLRNDTIQDLAFISKAKLLECGALRGLIDRRAKEEEFQTFFEENPYVLSSAIPTFFQIVDKKPYCGGKLIDNSGGILSDFLVKNDSHNLSFIEIKTPSCKLLSEEGYRNGIYAIHPDIVNAVTQAMNERQVFYGEQEGLLRNAPYSNRMYEGTVYVIAGDNSNFDKERQNTFELYRSALKDVVIITYNELFDKLSFIKESILSSCVSKKK